MLLDKTKIKPFGLLKNRSVMSAMTRNFSPNHLASSKTVDYYQKRAQGGVGLILTEATIVHSSGDGYVDVPYISNIKEAESWIPVINAVHKENTKIVSQLWHCGRISHSDFTGGKPPVSSTNKRAAGQNRQNSKEFGIPRALTINEIPEIYEMFATSANLALKVGFDAIQLHFGHGYLIDQFLDAKVNDRKDQYGGSVVNRCRFAIELLKRVTEEVPAEKVIIRISPSRFMGQIYNWDDLDEMLEHLLKNFWALGVRCIDISCANANYFDTSGLVIKKARNLWNGTIIGGASLSFEEANDEIYSKNLDLVTWGRAFIANPNLIELFANGCDLNEFNYNMLKTLD